MNRKYKFNWDLIGNLEEGRPNLGSYTRVEIYRLMQYCFRDVIEQELNTEKADEIFYKSGYLAGVELYKQFLAGAGSVSDFIRQLQQIMNDTLMGVLRVEKMDLDKGELTLTVSEDLDCSGLPELEYEVCKYDEGLIAGLLESYFNKKFIVKEVDCWCTGDRTCRFNAKTV